MGGIRVKREAYLFDTHALIFWHNKSGVTDDFIQFFDRKERQGMLYISSISFWEIGLLVKSGRMEIEDLNAWKNELLTNANVHLIDPSAEEMIDSTLLPDLHKDPFDRLLIAQAKHHNLLLVTKDQRIQQYDVPVFWL